MWAHYYQHNGLPDAPASDQHCGQVEDCRQRSESSLRDPHTGAKIFKNKDKVRYGQTKRKMNVMVLSIIFSLNIEYFSDGSSGGVLNPWISVPSCSRLLRYQLRPGGTKITLNPFKGIWGNAKCRPCWASFFSLPQKSLYHRFLVYDPYDKYFPFAIETFKLPASCACYNGAYIESHWFVLALRPILRHT